MKTDDWDDITENVLDEDYDLSSWNLIWNFLTDDWDDITEDVLDELKENTES